MTQVVINPATGEKVRSFEELDSSAASAVIEAAHATWLDWRRTEVSERAKLMQAAADVLRDNTDRYAKLMAEEMGKPITGGRSEIEKCAWVCEYYAENAAGFLEPEFVDTEASQSFVAYRPLGVILAIMPWNFPFWQVFRFAAPALMAGNAGLLKHAPNVPGCALAIEEVFTEAAFPADIFRTLLIDVDVVPSVIEDPRVKAVTLTGSGRAGRAVAGQAGEQLKKTVLELGGSDPYLILEDADVAAAAETCVKSRLINSGQSCIAAKRFVVVEPLRDDFEQRVLERMKAVRMGDPMKEDTELGPQAREDLRENLHRQVTSSVEMGARCLLGGEIPNGPGFFYPATALADVSSGMPAYEEELFGPVASIVPAKDERDAIRIANDSRFGLGAAVFTGDEERGVQIATEELEAGCAFVNSFVRSDPRLPFGGVKESGYGRELARFGMREFLNIKTVVVERGA